jgi:cellulose biosynthesis protein BcsQ
MYFADTILIPTRPTTLDLQATIETKQSIDKVARARTADGRPEIDVRLVLNFIRTVGNLHTTVRQALRAMDYPLATTALGMRDAVAKAVTLQTTTPRLAQNSPGDRGAIAAANDFLNLFQELFPELTHDRRDQAEPEPTRRAA